MAKFAYWEGFRIRAHRARTGEGCLLLAAALAGGANEERRRLADQGAALPQAAGGVPEGFELRGGCAVPTRVVRGVQGRASLLRPSADRGASHSSRCALPLVAGRRRPTDELGIVSN